MHQTHTFVNGQWLTSEVADLLERRQRNRRRFLKKLTARAPMLVAVLLSMSALIAINALIADASPGRDKLVSAPLR
ncbi:MAG TPA: hypothetical protein VNO55_21195 [Polyangia bacterium]|nr:hypothetical protein [Polyangia bacterium]